MSEEILNHEPDQKSDAAEKPKRRQEAKPQALFKRFQRGQMEFVHHLFKLQVAKMMKNQSWVWRQPVLVEMEHTHFYHSISDTTLQPNKYSSPSGGHFHQVEFELDADGNIASAKCGPALHHVNRKVSQGRTIRRVERVRWEKYDERNETDLDNMSDSEVQQATQPVLNVYDNHTHELEYHGSEVFTAQSKSNARKEEHAKVRGMMDGAVSRQPGKMQSLGPGASAEHDRVSKVLVEGADSSKG